jgi:hypothetical protein
MRQTQRTLSPKTCGVPAAYISLHSLDLGKGCPLMQPGQLAALARNTCLRRLAIAAMHAEEHALLAAELPCLTQLTALDLSGCVYRSLDADLQHR